MGREQDLFRTTTGWAVEERRHRGHDFARVRRTEAMATAAAAAPLNGDDLPGGTSPGETIRPALISITDLSQGD